MLFSLQTTLYSCNMIIIIIIIIIIVIYEIR